MGFRSGFVITSVAFLFGVLFIASIYDFPLLYASKLEPTAVEAADRFYLSLYNGPTAVTALLHGMIGLGIVGLIAKLHRWNEMAKYFDGGSLVLFMAAICMYGGVCVPNLRLLADPTNMHLLHRSAIFTQRDTQRDSYEKGLSSVPPPEGPITDDERVSCIRIISATNTISAALLAGVVILQISEWYLERQEKIQQEQERKRQAQLLAAKPADAAVEAETKKDK
ncbi:Protein csh3 [Thecaphora frezii]